MKIASDLEWIPRRRFALLLRIDGGRQMLVGRYGRCEAARWQAAWLNQYQGYEAEVYDTKTAETVDRV